ncbi:peptidase S8/S53 domain-containing protein [Zychaea mexicana]|uniref:peptidase S8/S53 domain-containing protein n=1 Tax=Zychaea mexicana TaxID=64656 RepID=UPI0022FE8006|nr:peptidase S8/S53 domain-containing protein [Zychaea mexicana]KAI9493469.1 peptidase S8/S53 domain-containing protein [Zychaea mexicana]
MRFTVLSFLAVLVFATFGSAHKTQNYIIQLNQTAAVDDFIPKFIHDTTKFFHDLFKEAGEKLEDLFDRDNDESGNNKVRVRQKFDIGGSFKAIDIELKDDRIIDKIKKSFSEVVSVFPDEEVQFELPEPVTKSKKNNKRYYIRPVHTGESTYEEPEESQPFENDVSANSESSHAANTEGWTSYISATTTAASDDESVTITTTASAAAMTTASEPTYLEQTNAQWNLVRASQRELNESQPYIYDSRGGAGVTVYVVDDGVAIDHEDFEGRATRGYSAYNSGDAGNDGNTTTTFGSSAQLESENPYDGGGHGTHVAGIIGGKTYGIAKNVSIVSVQVLRADGKGTVSSLLGGIQWVMEQEKNRTRPVVINMSLGLPESSAGAKALNEAVSAAVDAGLPVFAAAGNSASDACKISPAGNNKVYTVGSVDSSDKMDPYSCYGRCVSILAPGFDITSTYIGGKDATATMSGSSMAAPHVAGVAALLLPDLDQGIEPKKLYSEITKLSTTRKISDIPDWLTPNRLVFNGQKKDEE